MTHLQVFITTLVGSLPKIRCKDDLYGLQWSIFDAVAGGYLHIGCECGLVACVVWERRWGQSPRTMTASILPDAKPKRMRSQADLSGFWGQVGDRDYDVFVQEAQVHYSLANQF